MLLHTHALDNRERRKALAQKPNVEARVSLKRLTVRLRRDNSLAPFFLANVVGLGVVLVLYDDASGSFDLEVRSLWADHFDADTSSGASSDPAGAAAAAAAAAVEGYDDLAEEPSVGGERRAAQSARRVLAPVTVRELENAPAVTRQNLRAWTPDDPVVLVRAQLGTPVGGIKLLRHFEVTLCPLVSAVHSYVCCGMCSGSGRCGD
jgi:hypothetical protein